MFLVLFLHVFLLLNPADAQARCTAVRPTESVRVKHVIDGDTLVLHSGERVRLIGVNAPEIAKRDRPAQPLADEAVAEVRQFVRAAQSLRLQRGEEARDRHGRLLAHLFNEQGENLEERLLRQGLGWHLVVGANDALSSCLAAAEEQSRQIQKGVWSRAEYRPLEREPSTPGFGLVQGRVVSAKLGAGRSWWLDLDIGVSLAIPRSEQARFQVGQLRALKGERVEVRGWIVDRRGRKGFDERRFNRWMITLSHPGSMKRLLKN